MIISQTPFRVSFFGGGTDFPDFFKEHGGATLVTTIDKYCYISIHRLPPLFKYRMHASYAKSEQVQDPEEFNHPLIRETLLFLKIEDGLEISHFADLPGRTGLGSSSSFTVGLLHALHASKKQEVSPEDLARESIIIERERVGDPGGHQDQYAAAYGGLMRLNFFSRKKPEIIPLNMNPERQREFENRLLLFYTGRDESAGTILNNQTRQIKHNISALLEMLSMVDEGQRILLDPNESLSVFGHLLHETWTLKKSLAKKITNKLVDEAYKAVRNAGALGGKLLGAGGRGFLLIYGEPESHKSIRSSMKKLQEVPFSFGSEGSRVIFRTPE